MATVDKCDEATFLPLIQRQIAVETTIVSDCWKAYINLDRHGYEHRLVNSKGFHTNKIEGHWRQVKHKLPCFGVQNIVFHRIFILPITN
jgi:IS1 family transposase